MPSASSPTSITDLHALTLVDGLPVQVDGRQIRYREVRLRETNVADERIAQRQAERVVTVAGKPTLLVSDADFRFGLTARHIEAFECDGVRIPQAIIDLELVGKLSPHDLGLIEQRIFLLELAAEVRYGNISQADFEAIASGQRAPDGGAPQPGGQAACVGQLDAEPQSGPALLTDFVRDAANCTPAGDGR